jgi:hypothetical protein
VGHLLDAVLNLIGSLADTPRERAWHPLQIVGYGLLVVVAAGLVIAWVAGDW